MQEITTEMCLSKYKFVEETSPNQATIRDKTTPIKHTSFPSNFTSSKSQFQLTFKHKISTKYSKYSHNQTTFTLANTNSYETVSP